MASYYIMQGRDRNGPFALDRLQDMLDRGELFPDDLVWCEGMPDWAPARRVLAPRREPLARRERPYRSVRRDEDDERAAAPAGPPPQFPGRIITPSFFLLSVLLFFLPWVDVH